MTDFRVSSVRKKKKKDGQNKTKKPSTYVLENILGKPIRLLTLVMTHSAQDPFSDDLSSPETCLPLRP